MAKFPWSVAAWSERRAGADVRYGSKADSPASSASILQRGAQLRRRPPPCSIWAKAGAADGVVTASAPAAARSSRLTPSATSPQELAMCPVDKCSLRAYAAPSSRKLRDHAYRGRSVTHTAYVVFLYDCAALRIRPVSRRWPATVSTRLAASPRPCRSRHWLTIAVALAGSTMVSRVPCHTDSIGGSTLSGQQLP